MYGFIAKLFPPAKVVLRVRVFDPPTVFVKPRTSTFTPLSEIEVRSWGAVVPMPTLPLTIKPFAGATFTPAYVPIEAPPFTSSLERGVVAPIPTFTASAPVPPRTMVLLAPTFAFLPIAVMLVNGVVEATLASRLAW